MIKNRLKYTLIVALFTVAFSCDEVDPTRDIENPNLLLDNVIGSPSSTASWLVGLERQLAIVHNGLINISELGSDNYVNTQTFFNQQFDDLNFSYQDADVNTAQFRIADLRQSAIIGRELIFPADPDASPEEEAELLFYSGYAKLLAGEYFVSLPLEPQTAPVSSTENLQAALTDFLAAETIDPDNAGYKIAMARTYRALGDQANAELKAGEALALDDDFTRFGRFDGSNGPDNDHADALFQRGNFDDLQPLPRLDFLDPKYFVVGDEESPVYYVKAEEAYLILAEGDLASGDLGAAQVHMDDLLTLVASRTVTMLNDAIEGRADRPNTEAFTVRASAEDSLRSNLVLDRQAGEIPVHVISGTSVTSGIVNSVTTIDQGVELLYLLRQEIFISEGRRFVDLGFKMPVSEVEQLANSLVSATDIEEFVPGFIPDNMDEFTIDDATSEVTISVNMNKVISDNRTNAAIAPFFN